MNTKTEICDSRLFDALTLLRKLAGNSVDIGRLAGPHNAKARVAVNSLLMGRKMTQAQSGINAIEREIFLRLDIEPDCLSLQRDAVTRRSNAMLGETCPLSIDNVKLMLPPVLVHDGVKEHTARVSGRHQAFATVYFGNDQSAQWCWEAVTRAVNTGRPLRT